MFPKLTRCFKLYHVLLWTYPKKGLLSSMSTFSLSAIIFLGISLFGVTMAERSCKIMTLSHHAWNSAHVNVVHHESRSFCATFWSKIHGSKIPQKKLTFPLKPRRWVISVPDFGAKNSPPSDCPWTQRIASPRYRAPAATKFVVDVWWYFYGNSTVFL